MLEASSVVDESASTSPQESASSDMSMSVPCSFVKAPFRSCHSLFRSSLESVSISLPNVQQSIDSTCSNTVAIVLMKMMFAYVSGFIAPPMARPIELSGTLPKYYDIFLPVNHQDKGSLTQ
jgi:hypothetical protein